MTGASLDDGVAGVLYRKRTWWVEPAAWAVYAGCRWLLPARSMCSVGCVLQICRPTL
jgi:hypothetical protein